MERNELLSSYYDSVLYVFILFDVYQKPVCGQVLGSLTDILDFKDDWQM